MKISITADVHLASYEETPERYHALEDIFKQTLSDNIEVALICGDLFNENFSNYSDFEKLTKEYPKLNIWILPGNHDTGISTRSIVGKNIRIFETAEIIKDNLQFLFIPYQQGKTMGEVIADKVEYLEPRKWVLFGHGDWLEGLRRPNPLEIGTYMALTRSDLNNYLPARVFLGHIHVKSDGPIYYPGSPCGLDINETGVRRFLVYDSLANTVESKSVNSDVIYHECTLIILPVEDEVAYIKKIIADIKDDWKIDKSNIQKTRIRVQVNGYTQNKKVLNDVLLNEFKGFSFYKDEEMDLSRVNVTVDQNRIKIAESVKDKIDNLAINPSPDEPDRDQILVKSLKLIFEG